MPQAEEEATATGLGRPQPKEQSCIEPALRKEEHQPDSLHRVLETRRKPQHQEWRLHSCTTCPSLPEGSCQQTPPAAGTFGVAWSSEQWPCSPWAAPTPQPMTEHGQAPRGISAQCLEVSQESTHRQTLSNLHHGLRLSLPIPAVVRSALFLSFSLSLSLSQSFFPDVT